MLNNYVVVGRIVSIQEGIVVIKTARSYKNSDGEYDYDTFSIHVSKNISDKASEYVQNGDIIGVKGHIESEKGLVKLIGDKISFLSSASDNTSKEDSDEE